MHACESTTVIQSLVKCLRAGRKLFRKDSAPCSCCVRLLQIIVPLHKLVSSTTDKFVLDCLAPELEGSTIPCTMGTA